MRVGGPARVILGPPAAVMVRGHEDSLEMSGGCGSPDSCVPVLSVGTGFAGCCSFEQADTNPAVKSSANKIEICFFNVAPPELLVR